MDVKTVVKIVTYTASNLLSSFPEIPSKFLYRLRRSGDFMADPFATRIWFITPLYIRDSSLGADPSAAAAVKSSSKN